MPHFCLLFYEILRSWRPKGGAWHNGPLPKYAPDYVAPVCSAGHLTETFLNKNVLAVGSSPPPFGKNPTFSC